MTKRLLALFLVCILAIPIFAFPASATSTQEVTLSDADIGFFDDWYSYIHDGIGVCADYLSQLVYQVKSFVLVTVPAWTNKFNELVTADELGEWLGTMGADLRDGLLAIEDALWDLDSIVDSWLDLCYDQLLLIYNSIRTNFETLFGTYLFAIKDSVSSINNKFNQLLNGTEEDQTEAEDFQNQVSTESTEMQEALDEIQQATIPDYEGIDTDFTPILGGNGYTLYSTLLGSIFGSSALLTTMLTLAFTFALLSYAFFGKR